MSYLESQVDPGDENRSVSTPSPHFSAPYSFVPSMSSNHSKCPTSHRDSDGTPQCPLLRVRGEITIPTPPSSSSLHSTGNEGKDRGKGFA